MTHIDLQQLKDMKPDTIFASGQWLYDGEMKSWVAVRGGIWDWAIYYGNTYESETHIQNLGDKLHDINEVKNLINCTEEALAMYRH